MNSKLKSAIASGDILEVRRLLAEVDDINAQDSDGETLVSLAVQSGCLPVLQAVLDRNPDVTIVNLLDETPLMLAAAAGSLEMVSLLLRSGAEQTIGYTTSMGSTALIKGILSKNPAVIAPLVLAGAGAQWFTRTNYGNTPLMFALHDQTMLKAVWDAGASVSVEEKDEHFGDTALLTAIRRGSKGAVAFLVSNGANVHATDKAGLSALQLGDTDMAAYLESIGVTTKGQEPQGRHLKYRGLFASKPVHGLPASHAGSSAGSASKPGLF